MFKIVEEKKIEYELGGVQARKVLIQRLNWTFVFYRHNPTKATAHALLLNLKRDRVEWENVKTKVLDSYFAIPTKTRFVKNYTII